MLVKFPSFNYRYVHELRPLSTKMHVLTTNYPPGLKQKPVNSGGLGLFRVPASSMAAVSRPRSTIRALAALRPRRPSSPAFHAAGKLQPLRAAPPRGSVVRCRAAPPYHPAVINPQAEVAAAADATMAASTHFLEPEHFVVGPHPAGRSSMTLEVELLLLGALVVGYTTAAAIALAARGLQQVPGWLEREWDEKNWVDGLSTHMNSLKEELGNVAEAAHSPMTNEQQRLNADSAGSGRPSMSGAIGDIASEAQSVAQQLGRSSSRPLYQVWEVMRDYISGIARAVDTSEEDKQWAEARYRGGPGHADPGTSADTRPYTTILAHPSSPAAGVAFPSQPLPGSSPSYTFASYGAMGPLHGPMARDDPGEEARERAAIYDSMEQIAAEAQAGGSERTAHPPQGPAAPPLSPTSSLGWGSGAAASDVGDVRAQGGWGPDRADRSGEYERVFGAPGGSRRSAVVMAAHTAPEWPEPAGSHIDSREKAARFLETIHPHNPEEMWAVQEAPPGTVHLTGGEHSRTVNKPAGQVEGRQPIDSTESGEQIPDHLAPESGQPLLDPQRLQGTAAHAQGAGEREAAGRGAGDDGETVSPGTLPATRGVDDEPPAVEVAPAEDSGPQIQTPGEEIPDYLAPESGQPLSAPQRTADDLQHSTTASAISAAVAGTADVASGGLPATQPPAVSTPLASESTATSAGGTTEGERAPVTSLDAAHAPLAASAEAAGAAVSAEPSTGAAAGLAAGAAGGGEPAAVGELALAAMDEEDPRDVGSGMSQQVAAAAAAYAEAASHAAETSWEDGSSQPGAALHPASAATGGPHLIIGPQWPPVPTVSGTKDRVHLIGEDNVPLQEVLKLARLGPELGGRWDGMHLWEGMEGEEVSLAQYSYWVMSKMTRDCMQSVASISTPILGGQENGVPALP